MLRTILSLLAGFVWLISSAAQTPLRVSAAADLEPALPSILDQFRKASGVQAVATYQASATLTTQIQNGAPFDLFLSADVGFPKRLVAVGMTDGTMPAQLGKSGLTPVN
jgi:molybdate transport system substrate-binding protein